MSFTTAPPLRYPKRGAKGEVLPRSAAPTRGSPQCAHWGKGSPELSLEQMGKERADLNNHCHSEERSDVGIRSSLKQQCFLHGVKETRIATASLRTGLAMTVVFYTLPFLFPIGTSPPRRPLSRLRRASVSLRLGHGAALTCHRHVIHYRAAASLPKRGAKGCGKVSLKFCLTLRA